MRGYESEFVRVGEESLSVIFLGDPKKYQSHYIPTDGKIVKKNCHGDEESCPFCIHGSKRSEGLYSIVMLKGGELKYFDVSRAMLNDLKRHIKVYCEENDVLFNSIKSFLDQHVVTVTKKKEEKFTQYSFDFNILGPEGRNAILNSMNMQRLAYLEEGLNVIAAPGNMKEDG